MCGDAEDLQQRVKEFRSGSLMCVATSSHNECWSSWKKARPRILIALGVLWAVLSMASCASSPREPFTKADSPPPNKALIYLYRPSLENMGFLTDITLSANGKPIITLPHNTYYPYLTDPGEIEFKSFSESMILYAEGGQTYFIRTELRGRAGALYGQAILALVGQSTAEEEIRNGRKLGTLFP